MVAGTLAEGWYVRQNICRQNTFDRILEKSVPESLQEYADKVLAECWQAKWGGGGGKGVRG